MGNVQCRICGTVHAGDGGICRGCGSPLRRSVLERLQNHTTLHNGQYIITGLLGQGGFGITYDAEDTHLNLRVAIKELFLHESSRRGNIVISPRRLHPFEYHETKKSFLEEAQMLARFSHPGIVRVLNYFEENATAYLVMEYLEGQTMGQLIEKEDVLPLDQVQNIAESVAKTLEVVHEAGLLHRDIKPDNIFLEQSGRVVLIDFGSVRSFVQGQTMSHTRLLTPGYAPLEQYSSSAQYGPYTDLYAVGATLFHALTGEIPPDSTDLMSGTALPDLPDKTPEPLKQAITQAMSLQVEKRPKNAAAMYELLTAEPEPPPAPETEAKAKAKTEAPEAPKSTRRSVTVRPARTESTKSATSSTTPSVRVSSTRVKVTVRPATSESREVAEAAPEAEPEAAETNESSAPAETAESSPPARRRFLPTLRMPSMPRLQMPAFINPYVGAFLWTGALTLAGFFAGTGQLGFFVIPEGIAAQTSVVGAVLGLFLGLLSWYVLPLLLPMVVMGVVFLFVQQMQYRGVTFGSLMIMALILSIFLLKLIRRI